MENKDRNFWKILKEWDVVICIETWVEEKSWKRVKISYQKGLNGTFRWRKEGVKKGGRWVD